MDNWNAPQWADFDASVMSDIDEYFDIEHKELEHRNSSDAQYESFPSTPNSKASVSNSSYNTPKSNGFSSPLMTKILKESSEITNSANTLQIRSGKKSKGRLSMTPTAFAMKKASMRSTRSSTSRVITENDETTKKSIEIKPKEPENIEKLKLSKSEISLPPEEINEDSEFVDGDEENGDGNCTLVEVIDKVDISSIQKILVVSNVVEENLHIDSVGKIEDLQQPEIITTNTEDSGKTEIDVKNIENSGKTEIIAKEIEDPVKMETIVKETKNPAKKQVIDKKIEIAGKNDKKAIPIVPMSVKSTTKIARPVLEAKKDEKIDDAKAKLGKMQSGLDPSKRTILENRAKSIRPKPTVLTSQARRQSTSKYRRRSNKYVPLAEAVSKFQHGTPERFRSSHHKDGKGTSGPLQRAKQTSLKLTCAISPLLRCKFRARAAASAPTLEERQKLEIEEIRKNRLKPNPIKPSMMNPPKLLKKPPQAESIPKTSKIAAPLKKIDARPILSNCLPSRRKTMITPSEPKTKIERSASVSDASSSTQKTMMNPPKPLTKIVNKSTTILEPPQKIDKKPKCGGGSFLSSSDGKKDTSIMSTSILPDTARKHTPCKKTVPTVVSTDEGMVIKDVEILHFGIPVGSDYKKITRTVPFSFDTRNKELQNKRERLKSLQLEEEKKTKTFHARPAPAFVAKATMIPKTPSKPLTSVGTCSFQQRNELVLKKKKELFDQMVEREKQARIFHAKPAPNFKPVFVRGASAENLRAPVNDQGTKMTSATRKKGLSQSSIIADQENTAPNVGPANRDLPKLKNPLLAQNNLKLKKSAKSNLLKCSSNRE